MPGAIAPRMAAMLLVAAAASLAGCAGYRQFVEGKAQLEEGHADAGLGLLEEATRRAPGNAEFKSFYHRQREAHFSRLIARADAFRRDGLFDKAQESLDAVLSLDPANPRALREAALLQSEKRVAAELADLQKEVEAREPGQSERLRERLERIARDNPRRRDALALVRQLDDGEALPVPRAVRAGLSRPVSIELREAPLRQALELLFRNAGLNYMLDREVKADQRVTVSFKDKRIEDVLRLVLASNQLEQKVVGDDTVLVYPAIPAKQKEHQELVSRAFYVVNADVKQTAAMIKALVKTRDLHVDERLGMVVVKDTPDAVRYAGQLIAQQDLPESEVVLQIEILEVSTNRLIDLGIQWPGNVSYSAQGAAGSAGALTLGEWNNRNASLVRMTVPNPAIVLSLRQTDTDTDLLAHPRIRVRNREKARVHIGDRVPVITNNTTANGVIAESVSYLDVGLKLDVEPVIHIDDDVSIKLNLEVSNIAREVRTNAGSLTYQIGTRNASTVLRLRDGETQALAGLISKEERASGNGVPGLVSVPLLGRLFGDRGDTANRSEIVLLMTPHIVRNTLTPGRRAAEFFAGTESAIGVAPIVVRSEGHAVGQRAGTQDIASTGPAQTNPQEGAPRRDAGVSFEWRGAREIQQDQTTLVELWASSDSGLRGMQLQLGYEPALLEIVDVTEGEFFNHGGAASSLAKTIDPGSGRIFASLARVGDGAASGERVLLRIAVRARAQGADSWLRVVSAAPVSTAGMPVRGDAGAEMQLNLVRRR